MANPYYTYSGAFIPGTLAKAETSQAEFQSVQTGFAILAVQGTDTGAANAYVVGTKGVQNGVYADGLIVEFKAANSNTGASTINVDSGGVVGLTNSAGQSLASGAIAANTWYRAIYNSTYSAWTIIAPSSLTTTNATVSTGAPVNKVGLVAAGGVATSVLPSDATWALNQNIAPTWTGAHVFSGTVAFNSTVTFSGGLSLTGTAANYAETITGSSTVGQSLGLLIKAGTNVSDAALVINNQTNSSAFFTVDGLGGVIVGNPTGGGKGLGSINASALYVNNAAVLTTAVSSANPSASVGLSAVNGVAATFMTSDSAPALSQAIAPTWTAAHIFTPSSAVVAVTINAAVNTQGLNIVGGTNTSDTYLARIFTGQGAGFSSGLLLRAGTTSSDHSLRVQNAAATKDYFVIPGDGSGSLGPSATLGLSWSTAGAFTLSAPSAGNGVTLTLNVLDNIEALTNNSTTAVNGYYQAWRTNGTARGFIGIGASLFGGGALTDFGITAGSGGTIRLADPSGNIAFSVGPSRNITIAAPASGTALVIDGVAAGPTALLKANGTSIFQVGGTSSPVIQGLGPVAAALVDMTPDTGTFTITYTGMNASVTGTAVWARIGNIVVLYLPAATGTSNAGTFTATGMPSAIRPARAQGCAVPDSALENNSTSVGIVNAVEGSMSIATSGTITFLINNSSSTWTASGVKGVLNTFTVSYLLN